MVFVKCHQKQNKYNKNKSYRNLPQEQQVEEQNLEKEIILSSSQILVKRNKTDFSATENDSDSESNMTSSENIVVYSNEKKVNLEQELNNN